MFSFHKKKNLQSALEYCQQHHIELDLGQELSPEMFDMVINSSLFNDIDSQFKFMELSHFGGLAWFSSKIIKKTLSQVEQDEFVSEQDYELSEKMATVALFIGDNIPSLNLTTSDIDAILNSGEIAMKWLDKTSSSEEIVICDNANDLA